MGPTFYNPYQPQPVNPYAFQMQQLQQQMQQQQAAAQNAPQYTIVRVSGRNGAEAFPMGANSGVLLLDETAPVVWMKTTDGAGYPTLKPYSIAPYEEAPAVDTHTLEERLSRLEEYVYAKPNTSRSGRGNKPQPDGADE